jgi:hypothetical protein
MQRPCGGPISLQSHPTKCLKAAYFKKLILNWNKPEGLICKSKEKEEVDDDEEEVKV